MGGAWRKRGSRERGSWTGGADMGWLAEAAAAVPWLEGLSQLQKLLPVLSELEDLCIMQRHRVCNPLPPKGITTNILPFVCSLNFTPNSCRAHQSLMIAGMISDLVQTAIGKPQVPFVVHRQPVRHVEHLSSPRTQDLPGR